MDQEQLNNLSKTIIDIVYKIFKDILTQNDNTSYCIVRLLTVIGFFYYLILCTMELIKHCTDFSLQDMATGISIIIGVSSAGISLKNKTDK